jgi:hypothetical protein
MMYYEMLSFYYLFMVRLFELRTTRHMWSTIYVANYMLCIIILYQFELFEGRSIYLVQNFHLSGPKLSKTNDSISSYWLDQETNEPIA